MPSDNLFLHGQRDPFDKEFIGTYGRFYLEHSIEVNYMLSSLNMNDLSNLQTAADAFDFNDIEFEEMMQRDVDYNRVTNQIVGGYLLKSAGSVIFFPPIIVSVVAVGDDNRPVREPMERNELDGNGTAIFRWGEEKFEICLPTTTNNTGYSVKHKGAVKNFHHYAAVLRTNSRQVRLVVIDGQHRFVALQQLLKTKPDQVKILELPVCFVFSPNAMEGVGDTDIIRAFRNMFVTINNEAKKVSGHFITLLRDRSITATTIRELAEEWKNTSQDSTTSFLHMLEWNEREDNWSNRRAKTYSITTVGILEMALERMYAKSSDMRLILDLQSRRNDLELAQQAVPFSSIKESEFDQAQLPIIREQIKDSIVPALTELFKESRPYQEQWSRFEQSVKFITEQADKGIRGYGAFLNDVLGKFRRSNVLDDQTVREAEGRFSDCFEIPENDDVFFLNVFQQGMMRIWADLVAKLAATQELDRVGLANMVARALNAFCFERPDILFDRDKIFVRFSLYQNGGKPHLSDVGKNAWKSYVASTLVNSASRAVIDEWIEGNYPNNNEEVRAHINTYLEGELEAYAEELRRRIFKFVEKNYEIGPFDPEKRDELLELKAAGQEDEFDRKLQELSEEYYLQTKKKWLAVVDR